MTGPFAAGWRQVAIGFLLLAAAGMIAATYSLIAVPLYEEFQPSRTVLMLTMTVLSGTCAVLAPLMGNLMDRVSLRWLMPIGGLCLSAGYAAISMATSFNQVLVIFGVLLAPANVLIGPVAITVLLSRWFSAKRGRAVGIAIAGISAGGFFFPMIIQGLLNANDWRTALQLLSVILLIWTVPATLLVIDRPSDRGLQPDGAPAPLKGAVPPVEAAPISTLAVLSDPTFWMICLTVSIVTSGMKGMITNIAPMAIDARVAAKDAASLISIYAACGFLSKLNFAALADRVGPRPLMFLSLGGFAAGMAVLTQANAGYWVIAGGIAMVGLFGGLMVPIESYLAPRVFGQRIVGRAIGLISGTILIAMLITPPLFGFIRDVTGSYAGMFWAFSGIALAALLVVPVIRLHPRPLPV